MFTGAPSRTGGALPIAAVCCLLLLGFLIATTIVLALIPIYLPAKQATLANNNVNNSNVFYLQYQANADPSNSRSGSLDNIAEINRVMNLGSAAAVTQGFVKATNTRRRRSLINRRQKRDSKSDVIFRCEHDKKSSCNNDECKKRRNDKIKKKVEERGGISDLPCAIRTAGVVTRVSLTVSYVGIVVTNFDQALLGYGIVESLTFVAIRDGSFNDPETWLNGVVPFAGCSVIISAGIRVTLARSVLTFPLKKIDIFGNIAFGEGSSSIQFNYPIIINVRSGGRFEDLTRNKRFLFPDKSLLRVFSGGSCSQGTVLQRFTSIGFGDSVKIGSASGPFTCGVISNGIFSYNRVAYFAAQTGDITSGGTFLGDEGPSEGGCSTGCAVNIPPGVKLSTALLNGLISINFAQIDIFGDIAFGEGSSSIKFNYPIAINVRSGGRFEDLTSNKRFLFPDNSLLRVFSGGSCSQGTVLQRFTSAGFSDSVTIGSASGPFTCGVISNGIFSYNRVAYFVAKSGDITSGGTFLGDEGPSEGGCSTGCAVYIPPGVKLLTALLNGLISINFAQIDIFGDIAFGEGSSSIKFNYPIIINVRSGGRFEDLTSNKRFLFPDNSLLRVFSGGSCSQGTVLQRFTSIGFGDSVKIGSASGPFTCGVVSNGIFSYNRVAYFAAQTGDITSGGTFLGDEGPSEGGCSTGCAVYIPPGVKLSTALLNGLISINFAQIDIFGDIAFGEGSSSIKFNYPIAINVRSGGRFEDLTRNKRFLFPDNSLLRVFSGGSCSQGTVLQRFTSAGFGDSVTIGSASSPFTCGVVSNGIFSYNRVAYFAAQTGDITSGDTFLGDEAPSDGDCSFGCAVYIPPGVKLSTALLNGLISINFAQIDVASGATLELGTRGSNSGCRFKHHIRVNAFGFLSFVASGGGIYLPGGDGFDSSINFFGGGSFVSTIATFIQVFNEVTGIDIGVALTILNGLLGPFFFTILADGTIVSGDTPFDVSSTTIISSTGSTATSRTTTRPSATPALL